MNCVKTAVRRSSPPPKHEAIQTKTQAYSELKDNKTDAISSNSFSPFSPMLPFFHSSIANAPWQRKRRTESGSSSAHSVPQLLTNHAGTPACFTDPRSKSLTCNSNVTRIRVSQHRGKAGLCITENLRAAEEISCTSFLSNSKPKDYYFTRQGENKGFTPQQRLIQRLETPATCISKASAQHWSS